jgi:hypothetical protein
MKSDGGRISCLSSFINIHMGYLQYLREVHIYIIYEKKVFDAQRLHGYIGIHI